MDNRFSIFQLVTTVSNRSSSPNCFPFWFQRSICSYLYLSDFLCLCVWVILDNLWTWWSCDCTQAVTQIATFICACIFYCCLIIRMWLVNKPQFTHWQTMVARSWRPFHFFVGLLHPQSIDNTVGGTKRELEYMCKSSSSLSYSRWLCDWWGDTDTTPEHTVVIIVTDDT